MDSSNSDNLKLGQVNLCSGSDPKTYKAPKNYLDDSVPKKIESVIPRERQLLLKWNGWGYNDSKFFVRYPEQVVSFTGSRYSIGNSDLPLFKQWVYDTFDIDLSNSNPAQEMPKSYPEPKRNDGFIEEIIKLNIMHSEEGIDRLIRAHGQTLYDIHTLRDGTYKRIPDLILWPTCHEDVVEIVRLANEYNVALIPFGGGTSVSGSISCPQNEERPIVIIDTSQMNRLLWLDRENFLACFESGIFGQDLERELKKMNLTLGHEPDSYEFSTLGGWVATRASGMKKNVYGNIEDLVVRVKMVTSKGVLERNCTAPRMSCGPDFNHIIMGSEGTLGIVTEVVVKIRKVPDVKEYNSLVFPMFRYGVDCLREIAEKRLQPASIRLVDNEQFKFGQAVKPGSSLLHSFTEGLKKAYLTKIKGFDLNKMCVMTLVFEGRKDDVQRQKKLVFQISAKYHGIVAGAKNGELGYLLTFVIAYIRDLALEYYIIAESFETSVPWSKCLQLCTNTKQRVSVECNKMGITYFLISCRVTQTYDSGAAVYFYFGFKYYGLSDPVHAYHHIEMCARDEIIANGGSISHHHGIGKLRTKWYPQTVSEVGVGLYRSAKHELDPKNIFAAGNLVAPENGSAPVMPHVDSKL